MMPAVLRNPLLHFFNLQVGSNSCCVKEIGSGSLLSGIEAAQS